jgi:synaptic vesicle membrane protein VAT-1
MRAIQITGYGDIDHLQERELPDPQPGPGEVVIAVRAFGVNFADVLARVGLYVQAPKPPFAPGFEVAGVVAAVGPGVTELQPGDRVASLTEFGGYATQVRVPAMAACPIPEGMDFVTAAALPTVGVTARRALLVQGGLLPGETALIQAAAGGVGMMAVQMAQGAGARVIATCGGARKVAFLRQFGVADVIDYRAEDVAAKVRALTAGAGVDVILDSVGGAFVRTGMELLAPGGRFVAIGAATFSPERRGRNLWQLAREYLKTPRLHPLSLLGASRSYIGVQMLVIGRSRPLVLRHALAAVLADVAAGRLRTVIDQVLPAERVGEAHRRLQGRESIGKLVAVWEGGP